MTTAEKAYDAMLDGATFCEACANNADTAREQAAYWLEAAVRWEAAAAMAGDAGIKATGIALLKERAQKCHDNRKDA